MSVRRQTLSPRPRADIECAVARQHTYSGPPRLGLQRGAPCVRPECLGQNRHPQRRGEPRRAAARAGMVRRVPSARARACRRCRSARSSTRTLACSRGRRVSDLWAPMTCCSSGTWATRRSHGRRWRILLQPKRSGSIGPQVVIDIPTSQQDVEQPFVLARWAADLRATEGRGIATLHAWAYPLAGGSPVFLGMTAYGGARPDVAAVHGDQFKESGFGLAVQRLAPGHYNPAVFAWSTEANDFVPAQSVNTHRLAMSKRNRNVPWLTR